MRDRNTMENRVSFRRKLDVGFAVLVLVFSSIFVTFTGCTMRKGDTDAPLIPKMEEVTDIVDRWPELEGVPMPTWVPDGYEIAGVNKLKRNIVVTYMNAEEQKLVYKYWNSSTSCYSDAYDEAEMQVLEDVTVHGVQGVFCNYAYISMIMWMQDDHMYVLESAEESKETLLKMADLVY